MRLEPDVAYGSTLAGVSPLKREQKQSSSDTCSYVAMHWMLAASGVDLMPMCPISKLRSRPINCVDQQPSMTFWQTWYHPRRRTASQPKLGSNCVVSQPSLSLRRMAACLTSPLLRLLSYLHRRHRGLPASLGCSSSRNAGRFVPQHGGSINWLHSAIRSAGH